MKRSILFIDPKVADYETVLADVGSDVEVHILSAEADGVLQMAAILQGRTNLDSIQVFSHGSSGSLSLGSTLLNNDNLSLYEDSLTQIGSSLSTSGDLLLYGCNVAQGFEGVQFIENLAFYTGADVAASDDLTGNAALGGDADLESTTGNIETEVIGVDSYTKTLDTSVTSTLNFSAYNLSIHGLGGISYEKSLLDFSIAPQSISNEPFSYLNGALTGSYNWDLAADVGIKAVAGLSGGTFNLSYPVESAVNLPSHIKPGDSFTVDTVFNSVQMPSFSIDGPSAVLQLKAALNFDVQGSINASLNAPGIGSILDMSLDAPLSTGGEVSLFDSSQLTGGDFNLGGFVKGGYNIDLNMFDGSTSYLYNDPNPNLEVTAVPDNPLVWLSADIDDFLGLYFPGFTLADRKIPENDYTSSPWWSLGQKLEVGFFSTDLMLSASPYLKGTVNVDHVAVTLTTPYGESHTGNLGDNFTFDLPSGYSNSYLTLNASYKLVGNVSFEYGMQFSGGFNIKFGEFESEGWLPGIGNVDAALLQFEPTATVSVPFSTLGTQVSLSPLSSISKSYSIFVDPTRSTDSVTSVANGTAAPKLSVQILNTTEQWQAGYGKVYATNEANSDKIITIRITRYDNLSLSTTASYSYIFGAELDDADFVGGKPASGSVTFAAGEATKDVSIYLKGDTEAELNETLDFVLSSSNAQVINTKTRLLINSDDGIKISGSGTVIGTISNDLITGTSGSDSISSGAGNDTINALTGGDTIDAGSGNDTITLTPDSSYDSISGGSGYDSLSLDFSGYAYGVGSSYSSIESIPSSLRFGTVTFSGIENLDIIGTAYSDRLFFVGSGHYDGKGGTDWIYANWSGATHAITINNTDLVTLQDFNNSTVKNIEVWVIKTGDAGDSVTTGEYDDEIYTNGGNDTIDAGDGDNIIDAGNGNDSITTSSGIGSIYAGGGDDTISSGSDTAIAINGDGFINAGSGNDHITIRVNTHPWIYNYFLGDDFSVDGGTGVDTLLIDFGGGHNRITWNVNDTDMNSIKESLNNLITFEVYAYGPQAMSGSTTIFTEIENLSLLATTGKDLLIVQGTGHYDGRDETDTLYADWSNTTTPITWENNPTTTQSVNDSSFTNVEQLLLTTGSGNDLLTNTLVATDDTFITGAGADTVNAGAGNDSINGGDGNDSLNGGAGYDTLDGGAGDDIFDGGEYINGGTGIDGLHIDFSGDSYGISSWTGYDASGKSSSIYIDHIFSGYENGFSLVQNILNNAVKIRASSYYSGATFADIENLSITGSKYSELLIAKGEGVYDGKGGRDILYADWSTATTPIIWDNDPTATQTVNGSSFTSVERLLLATGSGNDLLSNTATSTNDTFITGAGDDTINAGAGGDSIEAGSGNDVISVIADYNNAYGFNHSNSKINGGAGTDSLTIEYSGYDSGITGWGSFYGPFSGSNPYSWLTSSSSLAVLDQLLTLTSESSLTSFFCSSYSTYFHTVGLTFTGIENLNLIGSTYSDVLLVLPSGGFYDGRGGVDSIFANWSNSTSAINIDNSGVVTVEGATIQNVERWVIKTGGGNDTINIALYDNQINSGSGNDTISTGAGADVLEGGAGYDSLSGGSGQDTYTVDSINDIVTELTNAGIDTVKSSVSWILSANLENLTLTGNTAINGTGNELNNLLMGNSAANTLTGGAGIDSATGYGSWINSTVLGNSTNATITTATGVTDTLNSIENIVFNSVTISTEAAVNDAPVAVADGNSNDAVIEAGTTSGGDSLAAGNVLSNDTDADAALGVGETKNVTSVNGQAANVGAAIAGTYGAVTILANGSYSYSLNNAKAATNALSGGQTVSDNFTYTVADAHGLSSANTLTINITGSNDAPLMTSGNSGSVTENADVSTVIYTAAATDVDANDTRSYSLKNAGDASLLAINANTGAVTLKASADFETKASYNFSVIATDAGGLSAEQAVLVSVSNLNEAPTNLALSANSVNENVVAGSVIGTFASTDADAGNTFSYSLVGGADQSAFTISANQLQINSSPDFETKSSYSITVRTTDQGGLFFDKAFTVNINDLNEAVPPPANSAPTDLTLSPASINENMPAGSLVGTFASTDPDADNTFSYSLVGGADQSGFSISGNQLTINAAPDFETKSSYSLVVRTTDQGGLFFDKTVTVSINDLTEAVPPANPAPTSPTPPANSAPTDLTLSPASINENAPAGSLVGTFASTDPDAGNTFSYSLVGGADQGAFSISGNQLTLNASADFETKTNYSLIVRTTDQAGLSFDKTVVVSVNNLNEAPLLNVPAAIDYSDTGVDDSFATVTGTLTGNDPDGNPLGYTITGGIDNTDGTVSSTGLYGVLTVNKATGAYSFVPNDTAIEALTTVAAETFTLSATDGEFTDSQTLTVNLVGVVEANNSPLVGTSGNDTISGSITNDSLEGGAGNDTLNGSAGADSMSGGTGNDTYLVDSKGDKVSESSKQGTDLVKSVISYILPGNVENLTLIGGKTISGTGNSQDNVLIGNQADNVLTGNAGSDTIKGMGGNDKLIGSAGNDLLFGGSGKDIFKFTVLNKNKDSIKDFSAKDDTLQFENSVFKQLGKAGDLDADNFALGNEAADNDDFIIYNKASGALFYDADGDSNADAVQIAIIGTSTHPSLSAADFVVV